MKCSPVFVLSTLLFFSCGGNSHQTTNDVAIEDINSETTNAAEKLEVTNAKAFIDSYKRIRKAQIPADEEVEITGKVFLEQENLIIINFEETRGGDVYPFALVLNPKNNPESQAGDSYDDISEFLSERLSGSYALLSGNFSPSPELAFSEGVKLLLLKYSQGYRNTISGTESIWYLSNNNELHQSKILANTEAEVGICEGPIGFVENIKLDTRNKQVIIERIEGKTAAYEDCSTYEQTKMKKTFLWDDQAEVFVALPDTDQAHNTLPIIAGKYNDYLFLAYDGSLVTGFYANGRYEGSPNFGCSFYFYGNSSEQIEDRMIKIKTLNLFNLAEKPRAGSFKLHGEEDEIFALVANLNGDDCWDQALGFADIGVAPGVSFKLTSKESWLEIRIATAEKVYFYASTDESTERQAYVLKNDPLFITERSEEWLKASYIGSKSSTSGWVKKAATKSLAETGAQ